MLHRPAGAARDGAPALRVTGGVLGGRVLVAPPGRGVRPTTDRVRESVFARLPDLADARVLDLFAGTGALGIEALSRGAARVCFVEEARASLATLARNLSSLGIEASARVLRQDVIHAVRDLGQAGERFDLVFLDPPYEADALEPALRALVAAGVLAEGGTVVAERSGRHALPPIPGLVLLDERRYGDTVITRLVPAGAEPEREGAGG